MGILWSRLFGKQEIKLVILGLDNAGKSTILYKITMGEVVSTAPTVGANQELFEYKNLKIRMWDLGGQTSLRSSWSTYYSQAKALIMVIDSTDRARLSLAKQELHKVATDPELSSTQSGSDAACLLIMANKQDVKGCMTPAQVSEGLALTELRDRQWQIVACSALTGKGLMEGMDWIANQLKNK
ncbi:arf/Sar family protein [Phakopsora pachyrhizi]|uniref:Arf/Sar family protein n=1 Tax=Phakopsora pachyrhizi TaxID=170000 RepID=A0AAV0AL93_PHAPC|nr:arf/Sar family protein [Phakopsora pachyrhizi]CAH7668716.1 arf/Sar family protein [Phakopsora pachyrhizi]